MTKSVSYNTKQKELILDVIKNQEHEFTIKDIYEKLNKEVGLTTIYRLVDKLIDKRLITKFINNNESYYQYFEKCEQDNHFYLKCNKCGYLVHIDCDCIRDLSNHVIKEHNFKISKESIIINGICKNCIEKI